MVNLLCCPFCGSNNVNDTTPPQGYDEDDGEIAFYWVCPDCIACGPICENEDEATNTWNKRVNFSTTEGKQLVNEGAIKFLFDNHREIYDEFYKLV